MKYKLIAVLVFSMITIIFLLLFNYFFFIKAYNDVNNPLKINNNYTNVLLVQDNQYTNQIISQIGTNLNTSDSAIYENITEAGTIWYYQGALSYLQDLKIIKGRNLTEQDKQKGNNILVSEKIFFENHKKKTIKFNDENYNIVGVIDDTTSSINDVSYIVPLGNNIQIQDKLAYQIIISNSSTSKNQTNLKTKIIKIIQNFDKKININDNLDNLSYSKDEEVEFEKIKSLKNSIFLTSIISIIVICYYYLKDKIKEYKVYQLYGISYLYLFLKIQFNNLELIFWTMLISNISYLTLLKLNGILFYSNTWFIYWNSQTFVIILISYLLISFITALCINIYTIGSKIIEKI